MPSSNSRPKALDLFCGAGGASFGLTCAGFDVTGVDIAAQPHYPYKFHRADATTFSLEGYDFIWASPPCQAFSRAQRLMYNSHPDLVSVMRERLQDNGTLYCIENVEGAPLSEPLLLCGAMFPGLRTYRHRLFESPFVIEQPIHPKHSFPMTKMGRRPKPGTFLHIVGHFSDLSQCSDAMGIHWMNSSELAEAIPPAYGEYIGLAALRRLHLGHNLPVCPT